ncbi:MAG: RecQ family ATP-dependent DNA helicase [Melioribacteraceae bacterium]|nr:RecQ family ATP-dependent DNA helicase [Melioribacteraceae bacterium]
MTKTDILNNFFGYEKFRDPQEEIIDSILDAHHVLAVLPTGAGKSICYQIPAIMGSNISVVISPLISLMKDQVDSLNKKQYVAAFINSSLDYRQTESVFNDLNSKQIKLLYVSPERLQNREFINRIKNYRIDYLFVDEAHCISEWGHNFRPSYRDISTFAEAVSPKCIAAFTATASPEVRNDIVKQLGLKNTRIIVKGFERENISLRVIKSDNKKEMIPELLTKNKTPAIIYAATRKYCEEVADYLNFKKINTAVYHAGLTPELRRIIQDDFLNNRVDVIAATNAFGMGIDKPNIRTVIHFNIPASIENYYQEFGRGGRDGGESEAVLFFSYEDKSLQQYLIESSYPNQSDVYSFYNAVCDFAKIALGSALNGEIVLDRNFLDFIKTQNISPAKSQHCINLLINSGYFKRKISPENMSGLRISVSSDYLKNFLRRENNKFIKDFLVLLLKDFGFEIFSKPANINEKKLSNKLEIEISQLVGMISWLSNAGIVEYNVPSGFEKLIFTGTRVKAEHLQIDYHHIAKLKLNAMNKLKSVIDYTQTKECRFNFIMQYFGEENNGYKCNKCDNCTGVSEIGNELSEYIGEVIIDALNESKFPLRKKDLVKLLTGKSSQQGLRRLNNFNRLKHYSEKEITHSINDLAGKGLLEEFNNTIVISEKAKYKIADALPSQSDDNGSLNSYILLLGSLKQIRKDASKKFNQIEEIICSDKTLHEIARTLPDTPTKLMSIKDFTQRHYNKIGEDLIEMIKDFKRNSDTRVTEPSADSQKINIEKLVKNGYSLKDIAALTKLPEAVISMHIETLIEMNTGLDIGSLISGEEIKQIQEIINMGFDELKLIKSKLPSRISYGKIRVVFAKHKAANRSKMS